MVIMGKTEKRMDILSLVGLIFLGISPITLVIYVALIASNVLESTTVYWLITLIPEFIALAIMLAEIVYELIKTIRER